MALALLAATASPPSRAAVVPLVTLTPVAALTQPLAMAVHAGSPGLYVAEKVGRVKLLNGGATTTVLDLSAEVSQGGEQGLLGLAFSPDGAWMYVDFTDRVGVGRSHVTAFRMLGDAPDPGARREILIVDQPFANHNGGGIAFGPDGTLSIAFGDGGSGGDPQNNGQRLDTLLGKILRIEPTPDGPQPYGIPADNPFVGTPGARGEIWAFGLRNPWRFSFDRLTGDLWIGDVGQNLWEEIDFAPASSGGGENYGWRQMEGSHPYDNGTPPPGHVPPVYEYSHAAGCSVTGGAVYRGARIPSLQGAYVFADFCAGRLQALRVIAETLVLPLDLGASSSLVAAFGEDASGELYVLSLAGGVYRIDPAI